MDRIVEVPLPDADLRRRLIEHHARGTAADLADGLDEVVADTEGATPAFLAELVKNAVFAAIDAGDVDDEGRAELCPAHCAPPSSSSRSSRAAPLARWASASTLR